MGYKNKNTNNTNTERTTTGMHLTSDATTPSLKDVSSKLQLLQQRTITEEGREEMEVLAAPAAAGVVERGGEPHSLFVEKKKKKKGDRVKSPRPSRPKSPIPKPKLVLSAEEATHGSGKLSSSSSKVGPTKGGSSALSSSNKKSTSKISLHTMIKEGGNSTTTTTTVTDSVIKPNH